VIIGSRLAWKASVPAKGLGVRVPSSPPSLAEASYGGRSPQVDREGEILFLGEVGLDQK